MTNFRGQVVLITGASSGIGEALAREFARAGASLVLAARRTDRLDRLVESTGGGARALAVRCDVTVEGDVERAAAAARRAFGRLDVVVANAGFGVVGPVERLTLEDYRRQFETNVFGVLRTVQATLPDIRRARGRIAIMGSVSGHIATPGSSPYAMSKFAVRALAEALGHELAPAGVSVTLVSPGFVESEIRRVDNRGVLTEKTRDPIPAFLIMPAARAARQIVRAIARRRREIVVTGPGKIFVFLHRHAPWLTAFVIRRFGVRSRGEPER
jgi:NAD(P)-dependent dehydrogenase (short-subunit alcohol dehydrogenase family)